MATAPSCRTCWRRATHVTPGTRLGAVAMRPSYWCGSHAPATAIPIIRLRQPLNWM
jgi:hypothetical protein